jgi:hypothetical protein
VFCLRVSHTDGYASTFWKTSRGDVALVALGDLGAPFPRPSVRPTGPPTVPVSIGSPHTVPRCVPRSKRSRSLASPLSSPRSPERTTQIVFRELPPGGPPDVPDGLLRALRHLLVSLSHRVPLGSDDEPETLSYAISSICPEGPDGEHEQRSNRPSAISANSLGLLTLLHHCIVRTRLHLSAKKSSSVKTERREELQAEKRMADYRLLSVLHTRSAKATLLNAQPFVERMALLIRKDVRRYGCEHREI